MATKVQEVKDALSHISTVNFDELVYEGGLQVTLSEDDAGLFFQQVRERGFNAETKRLGNSLVSRIDAEEEEEEEEGLGELFG